MKPTTKRPTIDDLQDVIVETRQKVVTASEDSLKFGMFTLAAAVITAATMAPAVAVGTLLLSGITSYSINKRYLHAADQKMLSDAEAMLIDNQIDFDDWVEEMSYAGSAKKKSAIADKMIFSKDEHVFKLHRNDQQLVLQKQCLFLVGALFEDTAYETFIQQRHSYEERALNFTQEELKDHNCLDHLRTLKNDLLASAPSHPACHLFLDHKIDQVMDHHHQAENRTSMTDFLLLKMLKAHNILRKQRVESECPKKTLKLSKKYGKIGKERHQKISLTLT